MEPLFETETTIEERFGKCPYATAQRLISGKWAILILHYLQGGPIRFNELQRLMPKMTHATLSVQLKTLVENGLVERKQYESIPPKVEYSLTKIGEKFIPVMEAMKKWGQEYIEYTKESPHSGTSVKD
jgi:putative transcriptional regulator